MITEAGFDSLYVAQRPALLRLARLLTGSSAVAEELVQEALLVVQQRWSELDNPAAYARRALVNLCHSHHRRRAVERRHRVDRFEPALPRDIDETWIAILRLPVDQRAVLVLRFYEDLSVEQTADLLDKPIGTVKSLQHRALERLKKELS